MTVRPSRDVVVVGASAGGVEALRTFVAGLPADFPAAILVVLHVPASAPSALPTILQRAGKLPARHAEEGEKLVPGTILVAPPDRHLIVYDGAVTLSHGPTENGHRPAVDVLFRSSANATGERTVGIVLSGALDDGAAGMVAIAERGGACLVQDFDEALHDSMPRAAAAAAPQAQMASVHKMPEMLTRLIQEPVDSQGEPSGLMKKEAAMADLEPDAMHDPERPGSPSGFACPDCHGALFEIIEGPLTRYRCRVGHAWSPESLVARQRVDLESALWMALRSLEEKASLSRDMTDRASRGGHRLSAERFSADAAEAVRAADLLRELIERIGDGGVPAPPQGA
jgi:two-component system chemotaxis response regulator CheB